MQLKKNAGREKVKCTCDLAGFVCACVRVF